MKKIVWLKVEAICVTVEEIFLSLSNYSKAFERSELSIIDLSHIQKQHHVNNLHLKLKKFQQKILIILSINFLFCKSPLLMRKALLLKIL